MDTTESHEQRWIPVRAVNAHVFCPRLCWLEYAEGEWAENHHTLHGKESHKRVDRAGGLMPAPQRADASEDSSQQQPTDTWHTRSLWLSDEDIGVTGKIDLVEPSSGESVVMPVDTKKGRPKETDDGFTLWPPDAVQLALQALLLRAQGYRVEQIAAWYEGARRRVVLPLTPELELRARRAVLETRETLDADASPPPLVEANRCHGCSLQPICLPDEWLALQLATEPLCESSDLPEDASEPPESAKPRRIQPPGELRLPLYISEAGARIGISAGALQIKPRKPREEAGVKPQKVGLGQVSQLNLMGGVQISSQALQACMKQGIPVSFFSSGGWFYGRTVSTGARQIHVRMAQYRAFGSDAAMEIARVLIADKIHNGRTLLRRNGADIEGLEQSLLRMKRLVGDALKAQDPASLLGIEGTAARLFWEGFSAMVSRDEPAFAMGGRNRRPPRDPTNALLSYGYALLCKECVLATSGVGLDPYLGMFHQPHHGNPALALDLMEPFRPLLVDSVVNAMIRRGEVSADDFVFSGQAVAMKKKAKKALLAAYERRIEEQIIHPLFGYKISYRKILHVQARLLSRVLLGEIGAMPSFRTR